jgi:predicted metal-dependent hydrolase
LERQTTVQLDGHTVAVRLRRNKRARRLILRLDGEGVVVTLPPGSGVAEGLDLVARESDWVLKQLAARPARVPFEDGAVIPVLGVDHTVHYRPGGGPPVEAMAGEILVTGRPEHLARRLGDWLRDEARRQIEPGVATLTTRIGRRAGRITMRDPKTRWASCAADGGLSFSWRLVMAPEPVLAYVVAHEIAHLVERGHGLAFWGLVSELFDGVDDARAWLRTDGPGLHRYG